MRDLFLIILLGTTIVSCGNSAKQIAEEKANKEQIVFSNLPGSIYNYYNKNIQYRFNKQNVEFYDANSYIPQIGTWTVNFDTLTLSFQYDKPVRFIYKQNGLYSLNPQRIGMRVWEKAGR